MQSGECSRTLTGHSGWSRPSRSAARPSSLPVSTYHQGVGCAGSVILEVLVSGLAGLDHRSASVFAVSFALRVFSDVRILFFLVLWSAATVTDAVCST